MESKIPQGFTVSTPEIFPNPRVFNADNNVIVATSKHSKTATGLLQAHLNKVKEFSYTWGLSRRRCKRLLPLGYIESCNKRSPLPKQRSNGVARLNILE
ncbi:hypothetical protein Trydic_g4003 [Trypoxylus dichotomus]